MKMFSNKKIIASVFIFVLASLLFLNSFDVNKNKIIVNVPAETCYAQNQPCVARFDDYIVTVSFEKNIYYLKKFDIFIQSENSANNIIESIHVDFKMKNMNMGVNRFMLTKTKSNDKKTYWEGKAILPVCVTGRADWFSEIEVLADNKKYLFTFPLNVKRN